MPEIANLATVSLILSTLFRHFTLVRAQTFTALLDCPCARAFQPVCGTDQQTYDSACFLQCATRYDPELRLAYEGVCCPRAELCADYLDSVCDQFGNWYSNDCIFEFHKCERRRRAGGDARQMEALRVVGRGEAMCGGGSQRNGAGGDSAGAVVHEFPLMQRRISAVPSSRGGGGAQCAIFCDETAAPVCDSQGRTHQNRCKFELASCRLRARGIVSALHVVREGPCRRQTEYNGRSPPAPPPKQASGILSSRKGGKKSPSTTSSTSTTTTTTSATTTTVPFAGELQSQRSQAFAAESFRVHAQRIRDRIRHRQQQSKLQESGKLDKRPLTTASCDFCRDEGPFDQIVPICDNTNLTHQSVCLFAQWNCEKRARGAEEHVLVHLGECSVISPSYELGSEQCPAKCSHFFKPVCDSNGVTHPNLCAYKMHSCHQRKNGQSYGWLLTLNECAKSKAKTMTTTTEKTTTTVTRAEQHKEAVVNADEKRLSIECPEEPNCDGPDSEDEGGGPVCDSRGRRHKNTCMFAYAHCVAARDNNRQVLRIAQCDDTSATLAANATTPPRAKQTRMVASPLQSSERDLPDGDGRPKEGGGGEECERAWTKCVKAQVRAGDKTDPHCGTDFATYRNLCDFKRAQCRNSLLALLFRGKPCEHCLSRPCPPMAATNPYASDSHFVCDRNGATLSHCEFAQLRCVAEARFGLSITPAHEGKCRKGAASGGGRVSEGEKAAEEDLTNANNGSVSAASGERSPALNVSADLLSVDHAQCGDKYEPVCGSDGRTYRNSCQLERRNATAAATTATAGFVQPPTAVRVLHAGECCPAVECAALYAPVCDSEGNTHLNLCEFGHQRCLAERMRAQNLTIASYDLCPSSRCPRGACPSDQYGPVCATNGRTYASLCELDRTMCVLRSASQSREGAGGVSTQQIGLDYIGECCESSTDCADLSTDQRKRSPVCDSNGITHADECTFRRAACRARRRREPFALRLIRRAECAQSVVLIAKKHSGRRRRN